MGISCPLKQSPGGDGIHGAQGAGAAGTRDGLPQDPPVLWVSYSPATWLGGNGSGSSPATDPPLPKAQQDPGPHRGARETSFSKAPAPQHLLPPSKQTRASRCSQRGACSKPLDDQGHPCPTSPLTWHASPPGTGSPQDRCFLMTHKTFFLVGCHDPLSW